MKIASINTKTILIICKPINKFIIIYPLIYKNALHYSKINKYILSYKNTLITPSLSPLISIGCGISVIAKSVMQSKWFLSSNC